MRLWSIHPKYLDTKGLLALWRESLLAQKVLQGGTKGYRFHPQLDRFKEQPKPLEAIGRYLFYVWEEAEKRKYSFDKSKITNLKIAEVFDPILVNCGQIQYEFTHLLGKLKVRNPQKYTSLKDIVNIEVHPIFILRQGEKERWEK